LSYKKIIQSFWFIDIWIWLYHNLYIDDDPKDDIPLNTPEKHDRYLFNTTDEKDTTDVNEDESETELEE